MFKIYVGPDPLGSTYTVFSIQNKILLPKKVKRCSKLKFLEKIKTQTRNLQFHGKFLLFEDKISAIMFLGQNLV